MIAETALIGAMIVQALLANKAAGERGTLEEEELAKQEKLTERERLYQRRQTRKGEAVERRNYLEGRQVRAEDLALAKTRLGMDQQTQQENILGAQQNRVITGQRAQMDRRTANLALGDMLAKSRLKRALGRMNLAPAKPGSLYPGVK